MWTICIPSYHRHDSIQQNTLAVLESHKIPHCLIKVFVDAPEVPIYKEAFASTVFKDIEVIASVKGCIENRAFIRQSFEEGAHLVYLDDDIKEIYSVCDLSDDHASCHIYDSKNFGQPFYKRHTRLPNLYKFLDLAFITLVREGCSFGGIYPVGNGFFAKHNYTTCLNYICGGFYYEINRKDFALEGHQYSEDFERSCMWFKREGKVVRFSSVMLKTPYYKGKGGLVETRTVELSKEAQESLHKRFPDWLKVIPPTKNNKYWNLKIVKDRKCSASSAL
jgi:hypothetical protein